MNVATAPHTIAQGVKITAKNVPPVATASTKGQIESPANS